MRNTRCRNDHVARTPPPGADQDRCSARWSGPAPGTNDRLQDENWGSDGSAITPSGMHGVLNDAISFYFADSTLASAFVARWCVGSRVETTGGVFQVREDAP